jgi:hypothetical protein
MEMAESEPFETLCRQVVCKNTQEIRRNFATLTFSLLLFYSSPFLLSLQKSLIQVRSYFLKNQEQKKIIGKSFVEEAKLILINKIFIIFIATLVKIFFIQSLTLCIVILL